MATMCSCSLRRCSAKAARTSGSRCSAGACCAFNRDLTSFENSDKLALNIRTVNRLVLALKTRQTQRSRTSRILLPSFLQSRAHIDGKVAHIGLKCLLGLAAAHAAGFKMMQHALPQLRRDLVQPPTDTRFMHAQRATNFTQLAAIEIVGSEDEALFRFKLGQRGIDGGIHARVGQR